MFHPYSQGPSQVVDVRHLMADDTFPRGSRPKRWYLVTASPQYPFLKAGHRYMFKEANPRSPTQFWAEVLASEIGRRCGVIVPPTFVSVDGERDAPGAFIEYFLHLPGGDPTERFTHAVDHLLTDSEFRYLVGTPDFEAAQSLGFTGYPAFRLSVTTHTKQVLAPFLRRIPPGTRADFPDFLTSIGLRPNSSISPLALLAYSEARDLSDGFSLVNQYEGVSGPLEFVTEVAGFRYDNRPDAAASVGDEVQFVREPTNPYDPCAIQVRTMAGAELGYVNRLQNVALARWQTEGSVRGWISRKNGSESHPRLYVFVEVAPAAMPAAAA